MNLPPSLINVDRTLTFESQCAVRLDLHLIAVNTDIALAVHLDTAIFGDAQSGVATANIQLYSGIVIFEFDFQSAAELNVDLPFVAAVQFDVNRIIVPCAQRQMHDVLAVGVLRWAILIVVQTAGNDG